jgi:two-component system, NtrC family, response regulator GlrR
VSGGRQLAIAVVTGPDTGVTRALALPGWGARCRIGTAAGCDLVLREPDAAPYHARLELDHRGLTLRDLGAAVPVRLAASGFDGLAIEAARLPETATFSIGATRLAIAASDLPDSEAPSSAAPAGPLAALIGDSGPMQATRAALAAAAGTSRVSLEGERGTGKSTAAAALHALRILGRDGAAGVTPLLVVDCRQPIEPLEIELFGFAMAQIGLPADAARSAAARARGGTLLLEHLDRIDPSLQSRLLHLLDRQLGDETLVIATARGDLDALTNRGDLKPDLLDRFAGQRLSLPPLAAREGDVDQLIRHFAAAAPSGTAAPPRWRDLDRALGGRRWAGNVAELRAAVERAVILA